MEENKLKSELSSIDEQMKELKKRKKAIKESLDKKEVMRKYIDAMSIVDKYYTTSKSDKSWVVYLHVKSLEIDRRTKEIFHIYDAIEVTKHRFGGRLFHSVDLHSYLFNPYDMKHCGLKLTEIDKEQYEKKENMYLSLQNTLTE